MPDGEVPTHVLDDIVAALRCPVCRAGLVHAAATLRCGGGHSYDVAHHGYVSLLRGRAPAAAETPGMVAARAALFDAGHLAGLTRAIVDRLPEQVGLMLDAGAGTGHHLAAALRARPGSTGVALDISKAAARRSARAHPSVGAVVADVWHRLPLADGCVDVLLDIFAPRHGAEFHRVLRPTGTLLVVTPTADHLAELVGPLGLLTVDPAKADRVEESLGRWFEPADRRPCRYGLALTRAEAGQLVTMGPSAWHVDRDDLARRLAGWTEPVTATVSVELTTYQRRPG